MPITKQDIAGFGNTLKDTLTAWGEQIQYGRDVVNLQKIQNRVQDVKGFTMDKDGKPLSMEQVGQKLFAIDNEISSTIRNPTLMAYARQNVGDFFKTIFTGAKNVQQNQLEMNEVSLMNPKMAQSIPSLMNGVDSSWTDIAPSLFKMGKDQRPFSPHYMTKNVEGNPALLERIEVMWQQGEDGQWVPKERSMGFIDRTQETPEEKRSRELAVANTQRKSFVGTMPNMNLVTDEKGVSHSYNPQIGKVWVDGKGWITPEEAGITFKVGTGQNETPKTVQDITNAQYEIVKGIYKGKESVRELGKVVQKELSDIAWKDIMEKGRSSKYFIDLPYAQQQEIINLEMQKKQ